MEITSNKDQIDLYSTTNTYHQRKHIIFCLFWKSVVLYVNNGAPLFYVAVSAQREAPAASAHTRNCLFVV